MTKIIIGFFIFCLVLFIYLHVQFHLKTSEDLEMYEIDQASKDKLEEICDIRQPVLFDFENQKIMETSNKTQDLIIEMLNNADRAIELFLNGYIPDSKIEKYRNIYFNAPEENE